MISVIRYKLNSLRSLRLLYSVGTYRYRIPQCLLYWGKREGRFPYLEKEGGKGSRSRLGKNVGVVGKSKVV